MQLTSQFNSSKSQKQQKQQKQQKPQKIQQSSHQQLTSNSNQIQSGKYINQKHYDIDVIEVSNIALAIKNKQHTINIQLSVRCQNLPIMKTFGSTDSIIVIYKSNDNLDDDYDNNNERNIIQYQQQDQYYENAEEQVNFNDMQKRKYRNKQHYSINNRNNGNSNKIKQKFKHHREKLNRYKNNKTTSNHDEEQWIQIGRTQIISNEINPKYIKTFVFSYNEQKQQKIQFRIYDIIDFSRLDDLNQQVKIGTVTQGMDNMIQNDHADFIIQLQNNKKIKSILKTNCTQYDSGNSKYQIGLQFIPSPSLSSKIEVYYIIQVLKLNQWIPILKSEVIQLKKTNKFIQTQISYSKFPAEDNSRIRIKIYQASKTKPRHSEEIGSTDQLTIINIMTSDDNKQGTQRVYKSGFVFGSVKFNKWRKVIRDSFISYIVNGATLHLILGIDFSNSNSENGTSLHKMQKGTNPYIEGIRKIIGVLQYFDYYNQIALYGFGAQLPPYYRSVSQCFALNGNYFNPIVVGGIEEIIKLYMQNLQKNKLHGPTKLSQMIDLAILYAESEQNSSNYYVLVLMTDGQINDFGQTVDRVVKASTLPLSIIIVGVGDKDFSLIQQLDSDKELLKSQSNQTCERDIVDFIRLDRFNSQKSDISLARQTFAEIPSQFIEYMIKKNIKPNRQKKSLKAAKQDFISQKIKQSKNLSYDNKPIVVIPQFLQYEKKKMKKDLINLGFNAEDQLLKELNIAMNDLSYFIEVHSYHKKSIQKRSNVTIARIAQKQQKTLEQYLDKKDLQNKKKTLQKLQKIESNQYGRQAKIKQPKKQHVKKQKKYFEHPCLKCRDDEIDCVHIQCGHASVCFNCFELRCFICYHLNQGFIRISQQMQQFEENNENNEEQYYDNIEEQEEDQEDQEDQVDYEDQKR